MGKLTTEVFNPSCCEGGAYSSDMSAQSCGCDKGANWVCERHRTIEWYDVNDPTKRGTIELKDEGKMKVKEWEQFIRDKGKMPLDKGPYSFMGLAGETGEVMEWYKKTNLRSDPTTLTEDDLLKELGDVLHYVTRIGIAYGWGLKDLMKANKAKLDKRYGRA